MSFLEDYDQFCEISYDFIFTHLIIALVSLNMFILRNFLSLSTLPIPLSNLPARCRINFQIMLAVTFQEKADFYDE